MKKIFTVLVFMVFGVINNVYAQTMVEEQPLNAEALMEREKSQGRYQELYENPSSSLREEEKSVLDQDQEKMKELEAEEKKIPSPLWGDARSRRETRRIRAEMTKEQKEIKDKGGVVDPKAQPPAVLPNDRSRRKARVEKAELRKKEQEIKAQEKELKSSLDKSNKTIEKP